MLFTVKNLNAKSEEKIILSGVNFDASNSGITFLLGRNGAGKSTFAQSIMGNSQYHIEVEEIMMDSESIKDLKSNERAVKGLFVSFQNPPEIDGVSMSNFLHSVYLERFGMEDDLARSTFKFRKHILKLAERVGLKPEFLDRNLNVGFSGGEKKRSELMQMLLLQPKVAILDEIDSGLDVQSMNVLKDAVSELISNGTAIIFITHNPDFVRQYSDSKVYLIENGKITKQGGQEVLEHFVKN